MENRDPRPTFRPTTAELYALESAAKTARAAEMARRLRAAVSNAKNLFSAPETKNEGLRHA